MPIVVYPNEYTNKLWEELDDVKAKLRTGEQPVFDSVDALFAKLDDD